MRGRWETTGNVVNSQSKHRIYTTPAGSCDEKGILDGFRGFATFHRCTARYVTISKH